MKKEILIADDHAIIRDGVKKILADTTDFIVAGEAANGAETIERVRERSWDLLVLDLSMPGRSGVELIKQVKMERARLPILVFSMHPEEQYAVRAIRAGASGYLSKEANSDLLLPALRRLAGGGMFINPKVAELLALEHHSQESLDPHTTLSDREFDIFRRIVSGVSMTEIADNLCLSIKTVSTHKAHILAKLSLASNVDLFRYAMENKLLDMTRE